MLAIRRVLIGFALGLTSLNPLCRSADVTPAPQKFRQEVARHRELTNGLPAGAVNWIEWGSDQTPWALIQSSWYRFQAGRWEAQASQNGAVTLPDGTPWPGAEVATAAVRQHLRTRDRHYLLTEQFLFVHQLGRWQSLAGPVSSGLRQLALSPEGELWIASTAGIHRRTGNAVATGAWEPVRVADGKGRLWAAEDVRGIAFDTAGQLWFATPAGVGCRRRDGWVFLEGKDGLPWNDFTGVTAGPDGEVWFATHRGVIRWDGSDFHYREGQRWLPHDDVRSIAVTPDGQAWLATANGVGCLERRTMTLAEKAERYEGEIERYIQRTAFGYVAEAPLSRIADKSTAAPQDSDNDGLWTAMYGAGECFAYGATHDSKAKARAQKAFGALRFLQTVTQGGSVTAAPGFVARTVRPIEWPDPNAGRLADDRREQARDALWKVYEPRWPKSADGKWYWKSDTSSDELDGHYFFYALYHDLVAESAEEKAAVREVVRALTDHLIQHGFSLTDHDGTPTRWGVYGPQALNRDGRWWAERGLNSLSILTYLSVAEHVTGNSKYGDAVRELVERHGYAQNQMFSKVQYGPGSGNQSDDEMAFMCYYTLLNCSRNEPLKAAVRYSFFAYWANEAPELNPFFNFTYAVHGLKQNVTNVWGVYPISPWPGWHEDSMATLRGFPLDRLNWAHHNSHRLDLVPLPRQMAKDLYVTPGPGRGNRVGGKVLPVENRHFNHWNTDPWDLDYPGSGQELGAGTVYLLPYYLGLYHGYIEKP